MLVVETFLAEKIFQNDKPEDFCLAPSLFLQLRSAWILGDASGWMACDIIAAKLV